MKNNSWVKYLVGVIVSLILFLALPTMAKHIINNDQDSRARDTAITSQHEKDMRALTEVLTEVKVDVKWIKAQMERLK